MAAIKAARELAYPYTLTPDDNGAMLMSFPDIPEAVAVADDAQAVAAQALNGLLCAIEGYFADRRTVTERERQPSPATASLGNGKDTAA